MHYLGGRLESHVSQVTCGLDGSRLSVTPRLIVHILVSVSVQLQPRMQGLAGKCPRDKDIR